MFLLLDKLVNALKILLLPRFLEYLFMLTKELLIILKIEDKRFGYVCCEKITQTERYILFRYCRKNSEKNITLKCIVNCNYTKL